MNWSLMVLFILPLMEAAASLTFAAGMEPGNVESACHSPEYIQTLIDGGQTERAQQLLEQNLFRPYSLDSLPLLRVRAALYRNKRDFVSEADTYNDVLLLAPNDQDSLRRRVFAVSNMGAPHLSTAYAGQNPELFSKDELLSLQQASAGRNIKWGGIESDVDIGPKRFQTTDKALAQNARVIALHEREGAMDAPSGRFAEFDRIVGLSNRSRMSEAIALYERMIERHAAIPPYVLAAVAEAYLCQRKPRQARDLYLQALDLSRNDREYPNREWQMNLFYAYIDTNDFEAARKLADQLEKELPPVLHKGVPGVEIDNEFYEQARVNTARARLYADKLNECQTLLEQTMLAAPYSLDARLAYGDLLQARDQPRAAQRQYTGLLVDDPTNMHAAVGIAETALTLNDLNTAKIRTDTLLENYPENPAVQQLQQHFQAYQRPSLAISSSIGKSSSGGGNKGNQDWQVETMFHSATFNQHWRVFEHSFDAEAVFGEMTGTRHRIGVGADYRSPFWQISGELNEDMTSLDDIGAILNTSWLPNDQWQLSTGFESNSNNIPLQASAAGFTKDALNLGMAYKHQESRVFSTTMGYSWFSDSNRRIEAGASWMERWLCGPVYQLETQLGAFASDNSLADAVYFNPRSDLSLDAQMINEWTLWRNYQHNFKNRLALGLGQYFQQDYGSKSIDILRYEHEWNWDPYRALNYGIAYERHPYDGETDKHISASLNLTWHF